MFIWYTGIPMLILFFDIWVRDIDFSRKIILEKAKEFSWLRALGYMIVLYLMNVAVIYGEGLLSGNKIASVNTSHLLKTGSVFNMLYVYILVIAPILEELTFRESLFQGVVNEFEKLNYKPFTNEKFTIVVSAWIVAFLFALVHNDVYLLSYEVVSLWLQFIYIHEKKISYSIFAHVGSNLITLMMLLLV